jgi:hypothetical protein
LSGVVRPHHGTALHREPDCRKPINALIRSLRSFQHFGKDIFDLAQAEMPGFVSG